MDGIEIKVVIPTKGRAKTIITHKYVDNCIVCVAKSELDAYKEVHPNVEYVTHPDTLIGLGPKRQWIYEKFGNVFMIDDDIKGFSRMTAKRGESSHVSSELAYWLIQNAGNMARLIGCYLFCFNFLKRPEFFPGHDPYELTGCINGCCFGILKGAEKLKHDPKLHMAYEWYISGLNAYYYRKLFIDKRFCMNHESYGYNVGGASDQRTVETERADLKLLVSYFGDAVDGQFRKAEPGKNEFLKRLKIPF